jgi:ABC-type branched-subunit amino acid transport system ATPase component
VIVLVDGAVLTEGPFAEVSADSRVIDAYFGGGTANGAAA